MSILVQKLIDYDLLLPLEITRGLSPFLSLQETVLDLLLGFEVDELQVEAARYLVDQVVASWLVSG